MSARTTLSPQWYRVAPLKLRLPAHARLHRHHYRGDPWYLLQDPASGRVHRFSPAARLLLAALDGQRSVDDAWRLACRRLGEGAPTQDEVLQVLSQLHSADLLVGETPSDALEVFERGQRATAARRRRSWANPMALRVPLWDPGRFLDRHAGLWRVVWGMPGMLVWLAVVLPALILLPSDWSALTRNLSDRALAPDNLLLLALAFPAIKWLHEMGHATATRHGGGEVHDMGLMLLVLMPVPYVDASASTVLRSKWRRAMVGAAGMLAELFVAALAYYTWRTLEPGLARAVCFNLMLVAGVSTIVFNGNPLLRFDAYYILSDLAEIPNLAQRASRHWAWLGERYLLRLRDSEPPPAAPGERAWFVLYGAASFVYRMVVMLGIALFVGTQFFFIGVLLAAWTVVSGIVLPVLKIVRHVLGHSALAPRRPRVVASGLLAAAVFAALVGWVPLPHRARAEGIVWMPEDATLRAGTAGFVRAVERPAGQAVAAGDIVVRSHDPALEAQLRRLEGRVAELEARHAEAFVKDRTQAQVLAEELAAEQAALHRERERFAALRLPARAAGIFVPVASDDLPGRWHRQGEVLGYVLGRVEPVVRVVITQAEADLVRAATRGVLLRLADSVDEVHAGRIVREVPAGAAEVPSRALVMGGGGALMADPRDPQGRRTLERVFEVDVAFDAPPQRDVAFGQRVYLRFDLEDAPLATQLWLLGRRLFLSRFDV